MRARPRCTDPRSRRGLAPLELVLSVPVLMMTMALMVSFGAAATWKVRTLNGSRQGIWRDRSLWNGAGDAKIGSLPANGSMGSGSANDLTRVQTIWDIGPIQTPVTRGPMVTGEGQEGTTGHITLQDRRYFEMTEGVRQGTASMERPYALLPRMGSFRYDVTHSLLDSRWQYTSQGFGSNETRRAKDWYNFEDGPEWSSQKSAFQQADARLVSNPSGPQLRPLDRDEEFRDFYGSYREFHPSLGGCRPRRPQCGPCDRHPETVRQDSVQSLIDRIQGQMGGGRGGVPDQMAQAWIQLYQDQIARLQAQQPPDTARIQELQDLIDQLNQFRGTLN